MIGLSLAKNFDATLVGLDMSKAFDRMNRVILMNILKDYSFTRNCNLHELLYTNTTLSGINGNKFGRKFRTSSGVPQDDGLSPELFNFDLHKALRRVTERKCPNNEHKYSSRPDSLPFLSNKQLTTILI